MEDHQGVIILDDASRYDPTIERGALVRLSFPKNIGANAGYDASNPAAERLSDIPLTPSDLIDPDTHSTDTSKASGQDDNQISRPMS